MQINLEKLKNMAKKIDNYKEGLNYYIDEIINTGGIFLYKDIYLHSSDEYKVIPIRTKESKAKSSIFSEKQELYFISLYDFLFKNISTMIINTNIEDTRNNNNELCINPKGSENIGRDEMPEVLAIETMERLPENLKKDWNNEITKLNKLISDSGFYIK